MSVKNVRVVMPGHVYTVYIGEGLLGKLDDYLRRADRSRKLALITDENVGQHYGVEVSATLTRGEYDVIELGVPSGESVKSWAVAGQLLEALAQEGMGRDGIVVGLGGGVVGDLAGFVAATYMRGIRYAALPTTLLAMVDSSIGGKTGVNLEAGKNLAGAFKQPEAVIMDVDALATLPQEEWRSGFAEIAKSALIGSASFWEWLRKNARALRETDPAVVAEAIERCVRFKSDVVTKDEREADKRECLNYGHTFGHALEKVVGFGKITHGEAVAEGMRFAIRLAAEAVGTPIALVKEQDALLDELGLPSLSVAAPPNELIKAMHQDKKARAGSIRFVLPTAAGEWQTVSVTDDLVLTHLDAWSRSKGSMFPTSAEQEAAQEQKAEES